MDWIAREAILRVRRAPNDIFLALQLHLPDNPLHFFVYQVLSAMFMQRVVALPRRGYRLPDFTLSLRAERLVENSASSSKQIYTADWTL
jgi:hypothetical protein